VEYEVESRAKRSWRGPFLLSVAFGALAGVGAYTFRYAEGLSYLSADPGACVNCHIMRPQYDGWSKSSHHAVAVCVDCHLPQDFFAKYLAKIDDPAALEKFSKGNDFLNGVRGVSNDDFNSGLKTNAAKLQKISDIEEGVLLDKLAKYDPEAFLKTLKEIAAKLN